MFICELCNKTYKYEKNYKKHRCKNKFEKKGEKKKKIMIKMGTIQTKIVKMIVPKRKMMKKI